MNENQKIVLKYLISHCDPYPVATIADLSALYDDYQPENDAHEVWVALDSLNVKEEFEVLAEFAKWGLENEN